MDGRFGVAMLSFVRFAFKMVRVKVAARSVWWYVLPDAAKRCCAVLLGEAQWAKERSGYVDG